MRNITHIHWQFGLKGGGEAVAMNTLEALQNEFEVCLITDKRPDINHLNSYYNTNVNEEIIDIRTPDYLTVGSISVMELMRKYFQAKLGILRGFPVEVANKVAERNLPPTDLLVNTTSEMNSNLPSIEYIHYPLFNQWNNPNMSPPESRLIKIINDITLSFANLDSIRDDTHFVTNSQWTENIIHDTYQTEATVVYPPVDVQQFTTEELRRKKESGFLIIGRLAPGKNIPQGIDIFKSIIDNGYDTHLHVIGSESNEEYAEHIRSLCDTVPQITYEGEVSRSRYSQLIQGHRYGIHTKSEEQFGITLAEMIAGGVIPFIPDGGGQREIIENESTLLWNSPAECIENIESVLNDPQREQNVIDSLPDIKQRFGKQRFQNNIINMVREII